MAKQLKHVKFVTSKGREYAYFNTGRKVAGKVIYARLPDFGTAGFFDSYAAMLGHRNRIGEAVLTIADLIDRYERSEDWRNLSKGSQQLYGLTLKRVRDQLGKLRAEALERKHVREVVENRIKGNGARNIFLAIVGVLYKWARNHDLVADGKNPTGGIKPYETGEHEAWPQELIDAALTADEDRVRLATHLLLYTGQRIGDVMKMRWTDIRDGAVWLKQQKTGKELRIPLFSGLQAELDATPRRGFTIITNYRGHPMRPDIVRKELKDFAKARGFDIVPHGLRKSAVHAMLLAECTADMVMAITGQSRQMVDYYARKINQHKMGDAAILRLERNAPVQTSGKTALQTRDNG